MNRIIKTVVILLLMAPFTLSAQMKFGHINSNELLSKMPKVIEAKKKLEDYGKQFEEQLKELKAELEKKYAAYQTDKDKWPDATKKSKETELQQLQERLQTFNQQAQEDIQKKQEELLGPIVTTVKEAIKSIAKEQHYSYIFDTGLGAVLYAQESDDITALVKKKLNIQ